MLITLKYQLEVVVETEQDLDRGQIYDLVDEITEDCIVINSPETKVKDCYGSTDYPLVCFNGKEIKFLDLETPNLGN